jgi:hypothetical protein
MPRPVKKKQRVTKLKLSGSEHPFQREPWETKGRRSNNCYAYAFHDYETYRTQKSVPGARSKRDGFHTYTHCKGLAERVISDNPKKVYIAKATDRCKKGYYKAMMVVAPSNKYGNLTGDFHFYKQHGDAIHPIKEGDTYTSIAKMYGVPISRVRKAGPLKVGKKLKFKVNLFSHKQGWATGPLLRDSCGKLIRDPRKACRNYGYNYSKYCTSFCVKNRGINVGDPNAKIRQNRFKIF